jgi:hypothetical protein
MVHETVPGSASELANTLALRMGCELALQLVKVTEKGLARVWARTKGSP